jgi:hypothetical protein
VATRYRLSVGDKFRVVQMTPPGSECSVHFGKGLTPAAAGSLSLYLVLLDIDEARADLIGRGVEGRPPVIRSTANESA